MSSTACGGTLILLLLHAGVPKTGVSAAQQNNLRYSKTPAQLANFAGELGAAARKAKRAVENERANPAEAHGIWQELFGVDY